MAELTPTGYKLKLQNEYFAEERQRYLDIDPSWNLDPSTPDGLKLATDAEVWGSLDETLQQAYNSKDPAKAVGVDLNAICALTGTTRSAGTPSVTTLTLSGVDNTVVTAGKRVESTSNGSRWSIDQTVTIVGGTATVTATCDRNGPTDTAAGTITRIVDTVGGWAGANNPAPATLGTDEQTDESLRIERSTSVGRPGNNQIDSLYGELYAVAGVRRVVVYENPTGSASVSTDNPYGLPANSVSAVVDGGSDDDVAMAIYIKKNPGCLLNSVGTAVSNTVTSPKYPTNKQTIRFGRPAAVDVVLAVTIKNDGSLPATISDEIKDAVVEFGAGTLIDPTVGFVSDGFGIGESVPYFTASTPINKVIGEYGNSYIQSLTLNGGTSSVAVSFSQMSRWTDGNVTVTLA